MAIELATVLVISPHPVIEGVVRLAAEACAGVGRVVAVRDLAELPTEIAAEQPAVIVVDVDRGAAGLATDRTARAASPHARIVVLSDRADGQQVLEALRMGVQAFLHKPEGLREIQATFEAVLAGERIVAPDLEQSAAMELGRFARQAREGSQVETSLSPREGQILALLAEGLTMRQIARRLGISPRTVETHVSKLYRKLSVRTRLQAVARAASLGLIELN